MVKASWRTTVKSALLESQTHHCLFITVLCCIYVEVFCLALEVRSVGSCLERAEEAPSHDRVECKQLSCPPGLSGYISRLSLNPPVPSFCSPFGKKLDYTSSWKNATQGVWVCMLVISGKWVYTFLGSFSMYITTKRLSTNPVYANSGAFRSNVFQKHLHVHMFSSLSLL